VNSSLRSVIRCYIILNIVWNCSRAAGRLALGRSVCPATFSSAAHLRGNQLHAFKLEATVARKTSRGVPPRERLTVCPSSVLDLSSPPQSTVRRWRDRSHFIPGSQCKHVQQQPGGHGYTCSFCRRQKPGQRPTVVTPTSFRGGLPASKRL